MAYPVVIGSWRRPIQRKIATCDSSSRRWTPRRCSRRPGCSRWWPPRPLAPLRRSGSPRCRDLSRWSAPASRAARARPGAARVAAAGGDDREQRDQEPGGDDREQRDQERGLVRRRIEHRERLGGIASLDGQRHDRDRGRGGSDQSSSSAASSSTRVSPNAQKSIPLLVSRVDRGTSPTRVRSPRENSKRFLRAQNRRCQAPFFR